ncbi:MAG: diguanylate cyclase [Treponema sp.]|nr:diguanylate cyclase [Treponema sp.]
MIPQKNNSILIIDDDKVNLKILTHILNADYTIYTSTSGLRGIRIAREYIPDLILLDILMPEMDGYQTLAELRNKKETKKIPIIFITGLDSENDEEKGLALNAADYITKPFNNVIVKLRVRNQIQIVNQFRTIEYLSLHDQLTKIANRRNFDEKIHREWARAVREKEPLSVLMVDIDDFKKFNDLHGHQKGDLALQKLAETLSDALMRPGDFAARWGGEEFAIILPNTPLQGAMTIAERLRESVQALVIPDADGQELKVTISAGVTSQVPTTESSIVELIRNADNALYAAKRDGKNRIYSS